MTSPHRIALSAGLGITALLPWLLTGDLDAPGPNPIFGRWSQGTFFANVAVGVAVLFAVRAVWLGSPVRRVLEAVMLFASLGFMLGVLEVPAYLGLVDYQDLVGLPEHKRLTRIKPWANPSNLPDEQLIFRHRPHFAFQGDTEGDLVQLYGIATDRNYPVDIRYDAHGHRNPEPIERAEIVLIGDSFIEAALVGRADILSARLPPLANATVLNLGHTGYGPQQELEVLRRHGLDVGAKEILWFFFEGNDLIDSHRYQRFARSPRTFMNPGTFSERSLISSLRMSLSYWTEPARHADAAAARSRKCVYSRSLTPEHRTLYFAYAGLLLNDQDLANLGALEQVLGEARDLAEGRGAKLRIVFVPTKFRVFEGLCEVPEDALLGEWVVNDLPERVGELAARLGVPYLDLTTGLRAAASAGRAAYFPDDGHWDANGHALVAELIAAELARAGAP